MVKVPLDIYPPFTIASSKITSLGKEVPTTSLFLIIEAVMVESEMFEFMIADLLIVESFIKESMSAEFHYGCIWGYCRINLPSCFINLERSNNCPGFNTIAHIFVIR